MKVSNLATHIIGSEIIKLAAEVSEKIKSGSHIYNLTIGDFEPKEFPIPTELKQFIVEEYNADQTNYPPADGVAELRQAVSGLLDRCCGLKYEPGEILIAAGARPVIYSIFRTLVDPGDKVIFATPSWNNNHYTYLNGATPLLIDAGPEQNFMPTASDIKPYIAGAALLALCSPQNPSGTVYTRQGLTEICDLVIEENKRRGDSQKPLYVMYDQIYWALTYGDLEHYNPVSLRPEMRNYTIFVDGISKSLAATGVRVGWSMGPRLIIDKMKAILTHIGAWAPKPEQIATARYLNNPVLYDAFIVKQKEKINARLQQFYKGLSQLRQEGYSLNVISPQAAIYLTVQFSLLGKTTPAGTKLSSVKEVTKYLLDEARLAIVPFYAFGSSHSSDWYRLSVGTSKIEEIDEIIASIRSALQKLV